MLFRFSNKWITLNQKTTATTPTLNQMEPMEPMEQEIEKLQVKLLVPYGELQQVLLLQVSILNEGERASRIWKAL